MTEQKTLLFGEEHFEKADKFSKAKEATRKFCEAKEATRVSPPWCPKVPDQSIIDLIGSGSNEKPVKGSILDTLVTSRAEAGCIYDQRPLPTLHFLLEDPSQPMDSAIKTWPDGSGGYDAKKIYDVRDSNSLHKQRREICNFRSVLAEGVGSALDYGNDEDVDYSDMPELEPVQSNNDVSHAFDLCHEHEHVLELAPMFKLAPLSALDGPGPGLDAPSKFPAKRAAEKPSSCGHRAEENARREHAQIEFLTKVRSELCKYLGVVYNQWQEYDEEKLFLTLVHIGTLLKDKAFFEDDYELHAFFLVMQPVCTALEYSPPAGPSCAEVSMLAAYVADAMARLNKTKTQTK
jgi:hypothetical protein